MGKRRAWRLAVFVAVTLVIVVATVVTLAWRSMVYAAGSYGAGEQGNGISWPQCGGAYLATPYAFGIVGVTNGRAFTLNPCLTSEYTWTRSASNPGALCSSPLYKGGAVWLAQGVSRGFDVVYFC